MKHSTDLRSSSLWPGIAALVLALGIIGGTILVLRSNDKTALQSQTQPIDMIVTTPDDARAADQTNEDGQGQKESQVRDAPIPPAPSSN